MHLCIKSWLESPTDPDQAKTKKVKKQKTNNKKHHQKEKKTNQKKKPKKNKKTIMWLLSSLLRSSTISRIKTCSLLSLVLFLSSSSHFFPSSLAQVIPRKCADDSRQVLRLVNSVFLLCNDMGQNISSHSINFFYNCWLMNWVLIIVR